jgi:hypothetical protein
MSNPLNFKIHACMIASLFLGKNSFAQETEKPIDYKQKLQEIYNKHPEFSPQRLAPLFDELLSENSEVVLKANARMDRNLKKMAPIQTEISKFDALLQKTIQNTSRGNFELNHTGSAIQRNLLNFFQATYSVELPFAHPLLSRALLLKDKTSSPKVLIPQFLKLKNGGLTNTETLDQATEIRNTLWFLLDLKQGLIILDWFDKKFLPLLQLLTPQKMEAFDSLVRSPHVLRFFENYESDSQSTVFEFFANDLFEISERARKATHNTTPELSLFFKTLSSKIKTLNEEANSLVLNMKKEWEVFFIEYRLPTDNLPQILPNNNDRTPVANVDLNFQFPEKYDTLIKSQKHQKEMKGIQSTQVKKALKAGYWTLRREYQSLSHHPRLSLSQDHPDFNPAFLGDNYFMAPLISVGDLYFFHDTLRSTLLPWISTQPESRIAFENLSARKILNHWGKTQFKKPLEEIYDQESEINLEAEKIHEKLKPYFLAIKFIETEFNVDRSAWQIFFEDELRESLSQNKLATEILGNMFDLVGNQKHLGYQLLLNLSLSRAVPKDLKDCLEKLTDENAEIDPIKHKQVTDATFWALSCFPFKMEKLLSDENGLETSSTNATTDESPLVSILSFQLDWTDALDLNGDGLINEWDHLRALAAELLLF